MLFNLFLANSYVPHQWKRASILPIPKISAPKLHTDFRPISITPVLTRVMERTVVQRFMYPAFLSPPPTLTLSDQFAFRPTGSTTAALISFLNIITNMLLTNPYVIVIALDFSKAFDTVRHSTLLEKLAQLDMPDNAYNWLVSFFSGHSHCTVYQGQTSKLKDITASIIQGSGIGPAAYVAYAADLRTEIPSNRLIKFADDTYLLIPAINAESRPIELKNVETWARVNNLTLNNGKTKEIVFVDRKRRRRGDIAEPPAMPAIERVTSLKVLGVTWTTGLSATEHVRCIINACAQTLYALKILRAHGLTDVALQAVYKSVILAKLLYASSAWWGFTSASDRQRIEGFMRRGKRIGFCPPDTASFEEMCSSADDKLFNKIKTNEGHTLHEQLPPTTIASQNYSLRTRAHNRQLPNHVGHLSDCNYITRVLYKDIY